MKYIRSCCAIFISVLVFSSCNTIEPNEYTASRPDQSASVSTLTIDSSIASLEPAETVTDGESEESPGSEDTGGSLIVSDISDSILESESGSEDLIEKIENILSPLEENNSCYSLMMMSENDDTMLSLGKYDEKMVSASLIKLFVAATVYEHFDSVSCYEEYDGETEYLLNIMISQSDNAACNTLVTRLGSESAQEGMSIVNQFCSKNGFDHTQMNRLMLDFNGLENYTSANDCCTILKAFLNNEFVGSQKIIKYMKNQKTRTKIPAGIPEDIIVANKTGELSTVENDAAIVFAENGIYYLCIMTGDLYDTDEARNIIASVSSAIYNSFDKIS